MRWFAVASLIRDDPKLVQLGETHGTAAFSIALGLFSEAAKQERAGSAQITYRNFAHSLFLDADTVRTVLADAATVGLIILEEETDHSATIHLPAWERHQGNYRKAKSRAKVTTTDLSNVTESHATSRDVLNKTRQERRRENNVVGKPADPPLSTLLAELVEQNTGRPPRIGKRWHEAERLLIERDKRDPDQAERLLRWSQNNEFWRAVVLSMPKFREKYDEILLQARRGQQQRKQGRAATPVIGDRNRGQHEKDLAWATENIPDLPAALVASAIGTLRLAKADITIENVRGRLTATGRIPTTESKAAA